MIKRGICLLINFIFAVGILLQTNLCIGEDLEKATAEGYREAVKESETDVDETKVYLPDPKPQIPPAGLIPQNILSLGDGDYFSKYAFVADKSTRTLTVWQNENQNFELLAVYPFDMGKKEGDKEVLGDLKTPEGVYFFNNSYSRNQLDYNEYGALAFTTNYPNFFDQLEHKTGSGIWLHAIPPTKSLNRGSRGCLVIRNEAIESVHPYINTFTTPLIIEDKISYSNFSDLKNMKQNLYTWLEKWKLSWETKKIEHYMEHYHSDFKANNMNKEKWKKYKTDLSEKYEYINIKLYTPVVFKHKDEYIVRFLQKYESNTLNDFGEKTLFVKQIGDKYKIIGEEWKPVNNGMIATYEDKCIIPGC